MDQASDLPKLTSFNLNQLDAKLNNINGMGYKKSLFATGKEGITMHQVHHYNHLNEEAITYQRQMLLNILDNT